MVEASNDATDVRKRCENGEDRQGSGLREQQQQQEEEQEQLQLQKADTIRQCEETKQAGAREKEQRRQARLAVSLIR